MKKKIVLLLVTMLLLLAACQPNYASNNAFDPEADYSGSIGSSGEVDSSQDSEAVDLSEARLLIFDRGDCIGAVYVVTYADLQYWDIRQIEISMPHSDRPIKRAATEEQKRVYLQAESHSEAIENLSVLIQSDGTVLPQPASCDSGGE